MSNTTANVTAGKGKVAGYAFRAPLGTALPTDATTALASAYIGLGFISEDGITNTNSPETENILDMNKTPVLNIMTAKEDTFQAKFIESKNLEVLKMVYGEDNVTGTLATGITIKANAKDLGAYVYVFDLETSGGGNHRIVLPNAKPGEIGDIVYVADDAVGYEVTLNCVADASGQTHYEYLQEE